MSQKKQLGYIEIIDERCKGCELCVPACPVDILEMGPRINSTGYNLVEINDMKKCIACKLCALICPDKAIDVFRFKKPILHEV